MKASTAFLFCIFFNFAYSQQLQTIELLPPESAQTTDLQFLKTELEGRQVVMLGEHTHMHGNIFEMKARVVEYLHKELGFTTFAMESPMYDIWKMNRRGFSKEGFNDAVFPVWSETSEFQRLVNYLEDNDLKVIGFDSQVNDISNFIDNFFEYCDTNQIGLKLERDDMGIVIEAVLHAQGFDESDIKFESFEKELNRIIKRIQQLEDTEDNYYWRQFAKSLLAGAHDAFYNTERIYSTVVGDKDYNIRDRQMADNLLTYIKRHPNEKIVCWGDNIHFINDNSSVAKPIAKDFVPMGSYIKKELKDKVYSLATIHANDSLLNTKLYKYASTPIRKPSFEDELKQLGKPYLFVSSDQPAMKMPKYTRLLDFIDFTELRVDQLHDGYIFFSHATVPKKEYERVLLSRNRQKTDPPEVADDAEKIKQVKGQLLDEETNQPIPFATLVIRNHNMYRIADEDGKFVLPVKVALQDGLLVEISSVGYETKSWPVNKISGKVYLKSQFEALSEVVIKRSLIPKEVLKKAISNIKTNHPTSPFNFDRYSKIVVTKNDQYELDLELITKDYNQGYLSPYITTQRVEQVKWNAKSRSDRFKTSSRFFSFRENPIQYANILHKRKYKKFKLNYSQSTEKDSENWYIIEFETDRNKWSYTNRGFPTKYSGRVYVDKQTFAIVRVVENWKTALNQNEIKTYFKHSEGLKNVFQITLKEENEVHFSSIDNSVYYATEYFGRTISEKITDKGAFENDVSEIHSKAFNFITDAVEEIAYPHQVKENVELNRVSYNADFWTAFYATDIAKP